MSTLEESVNPSEAGRDLLLFVDHIPGLTLRELQHLRGINAETDSISNTAGCFLERAIVLRCISPSQCLINQDSCIQGRRAVGWSFGEACRGVGLGDSDIIIHSTK